MIASKFTIMKELGELKRVRKNLLASIEHAREARLVADEASRSFGWAVPVEENGLRSLMNPSINRCDELILDAQTRLKAAANP